MIIELTETLYIHFGKEEMVKKEDVKAEGDNIYFDDIGASAKAVEVLESLNNEKVIFQIAVCDYFFGIYKE